LVHTQACPGMPLESPRCCICTAQPRCLVPLAHGSWQRWSTVRCTVHHANSHVLKSFVQPGSHLKKSVIRNYVHRDQMFLKTRHSKSERFGVFLGGSQGDSSFTSQNSWARPAEVNRHNFSDLLQRGVLHQLQICTLTILMLKSRGLLSGLGLSLFTKYLQQRVV